MPWTGGCLHRPRRSRSHDTHLRKREPSPQLSALVKDEAAQRKSDVPEAKRAHSVVELQRWSAGEPWGVVLVSGGGPAVGVTCPRIAHLAPGSLAYRSDMLAPGDLVTSVNGISARGMRADDATALIDSAHQKLVLDVEYEIPAAPLSGDGDGDLEAKSAGLSVCPKVIQVKLEKDEGASLGFLLRGGACADSAKSRPLTVVRLRPGGSADREGTIKVAVQLIHQLGMPNVTASVCASAAKRSHTRAKQRCAAHRFAALVASVLLLLTRYCPSPAVPAAFTALLLFFDDFFALAIGSCFSLLQLLCCCSGSNASKLLVEVLIYRCYGEKLLEFLFAAQAQPQLFTRFT